MHPFEYPTAEIEINVHEEPFQVVVGVSSDLPRHVLIAKLALWLLVLKQKKNLTKYDKRKKKNQPVA